MPRLTFVNTSPIQYLHQLGMIDLLRNLFGHIQIPSEVLKEIERGKSEGVSLPDLSAVEWVELHEPLSRPVFPLIRDLGQGEIAVISLGLENPGSLVVLDDFLARRTALEMNLRLTGTAGILIAAKKAGLINGVSPILEKLSRLGFFLASRHKFMILEKAGELPTINAR